MKDCPDNLPQSVVKSFFLILVEIIEAKNELDKYDHYFHRTCDEDKLVAARTRFNRAVRKGEDILKYIETN